MKTIEKALDLLFLFANSAEPLGVETIAAQLKMPRSTAYRFVKTLHGRKLIELSNRDGRYRLGIKVLEFYRGFVNVYGLREAALPHMRALTSETGNTSYLCIESAGLAVCVESVESAEGLISRLGVGRTVPLHAGASAKVLLAYLPEARQHAVLEGRLVVFTKFTMTGPRAIRRALERIRVDGFAYTSQEVDPGSRSIAVAIYDFSGQVIAALGIAGPMHKFDERNLRKLAKTVKSYGQMISEKLGYSGSDQHGVRDGRML